MELSYEDTIRGFKLEHAKEITKMRQEFDLNAKELQQKSDRKIKTLREECDLRRKQEIHEIEERKNVHVNELMKKHEKAFTEIKCYYNDITHNNLDLIKTLKEDVTDMKKKEAANEKLMYEIAQENKRLTEPLTRALREVEELRKQLANYDKVQLERDEFYAKFESSIFEVQQKCGLQNLLLQRKVQILAEKLEKKAHNDLVRAFEAKLAEFGIPLEEMGLPHYISNSSM
ncbi:hypothetical protein BDL97_15G020300 [Sphagnum fallax]|nr:hypothetical protein BDL97_15G020300 [Sphagnum fallax]